MLFILVAEALFQSGDLVPLLLCLLFEARLVERREFSALLQLQLQLLVFFLHILNYQLLLRERDNAISGHAHRLR